MRPLFANLFNTLIPFALLSFFLHFYKNMVVQNLENHLKPSSDIQKQGLQGFSCKNYIPNYLLK